MALEKRTPASNLLTPDNDQLSQLREWVILQTLSMNLDTLIWRFRVLQTKVMGKLPALPWSQIPRTLAQPFENWNYSYFATPVPGECLPDMVLYETLIGRFYGRVEDRAPIP
jgi:hypothetical protein